jgi:hypothetical protein
MIWLQERSSLQAREAIVKRHVAKYSDSEADVCRYLLKATLRAPSIPLSFPSDEISYPPLRHRAVLNADIKCSDRAFIIEGEVAKTGRCIGFMLHISLVSLIDLAQALIKLLC